MFLNLSFLSLIYEVFGGEVNGSTFIASRKKYKVILLLCYYYTVFTSVDKQLIMCYKECYYSSDVHNSYTHNSSQQKTFGIERYLVEWLAGRLVPYFL